MTDSSRRKFLRDAGLSFTAFVVAGCTGSKQARVPATTSTTSTFPAGPQFGDLVDAGPLAAILTSIANKHAPVYVPEARSYVSPFPAALIDEARAIYPPEAMPGIEAGVVVLYQRCTHLGCRVPFCESSQFFECPCHGAKFDLVGEKRAGPAPRGMDLMKTAIVDERLVIDTGTILVGLPIGTNTTHQKQHGPFCV